VLISVWRDPDETHGNSNKSVAVSRVKDTTSLSRSPIRRLRASRPDRSARPPPVPEAPSSRQRVQIHHGLASDLARYFANDGRDSMTAATTRAARRRSPPTTFLPPPLERDRPRSRNGVPSSIPTPPPDTSSRHTSSAQFRALHRTQAVPDGPIYNALYRSDNGLGDRDRSPSPIPNPWQVIGSTITPDVSLPSADTSFASTTASTSFHSTSLSSSLAGSDHEAAGSGSPIQSENRRAVERLLYDFAMRTSEGRAQIRLLNDLPRDSPHLSLGAAAQDDDGDDDDDEEEEDGDGDEDDQQVQAQDRAPPRQPAQFDSDIRERSRQVAASTLRFFDRPPGLNAPRSFVRMRLANDRYSVGQPPHPNPRHDRGSRGPGSSRPVFGGADEF
jgi:hypothetical protein